jgi:uncharacterized Tic20 family protein
VIRHSYADPFVRHHTAQTLNAALTWPCSLVLVAAGIGFLALGEHGLSFIGFIPGALLILAFVVRNAAAWICEIAGGVKAHHGQRYSFPRWVAFRFLGD